LTGQIVQTVKDAGYRLAKKDPERPHAKAHGIDLTKLHAASLFFLPCQPEDPKGKIWKDHKGPTRHALNVDDWLENAIPVEVDDFEPEPSPPGSDDQEWDRARADRAMERWNMHGTQKGKGDGELFILNQQLMAANVPRYEREVMLLDAARQSTSPRDRLRQARRLARMR
jgi:hypothetical protein